MAAVEITSVVSQKSKVKQIASMFDAQIAHSVDGVKNETRLDVNSSSQPAGVHIQPPGHIENSIFCKQKAPVSTKVELTQNSHTHAVSENGCVKNKVQLYNQFTSVTIAEKPKPVEPPKVRLRKRKPAPPVPVSKAASLQKSTNILHQPQPTNNVTEEAGSATKNLLYPHFSDLKLNQFPNEEEQAEVITKSCIDQQLENIQPNDKEVGAKKLKPPQTKLRQRKKKPAPPVPVSKATNFQIMSTISVEPQSCIDQQLLGNIQPNDKEVGATKLKPPKTKLRQCKKKPAPPVPASKATNSQTMSIISVEPQVNEALPQTTCCPRPKSGLCLWLNLKQSEKNYEKAEFVRQITLDNENNVINKDHEKKPHKMEPTKRRKKCMAPPVPANKSNNIADKPTALNKAAALLVMPQKPPENELQKSHEHNPAALSEHQLRIQASLQRLNIPDWFRQYNQKSPDGASTGTSTYKPGNFTRKRTQESGRWAGLNSKTTSLSSLGSQRSDRSPLLLSPSAHSHHGGQSSQHAAQHGGHASNAGAATSGSNAFSRWSTSHLNSSQTSPSVSQRGSFSRGGPINSSFMSVNSGHSVIRNSMRQPYLGWRSQEKLSQRTAHERLASSLLSQQQQQQRTPPTTINPSVAANNDKLQPVTPEIQTSIKEVTSAIVHYVNDQTNQQRSRSTSPNSRKCWLESSFVGARPWDLPQTPVIENTPLIAAAQAAATTSSTSSSGSRSVLLNSNNNNNNLQYLTYNNIDGSLNLSVLTGNDIQLTRMNGGLNNGTSSSSAGGVNLGVERSLSNASLEDVLASLLGLPTHQTGANASDAYARSSTGGALVSESQTPTKQNQQKPQQPNSQHHMPQRPQPLQLVQDQEQKENLLVISKEEQQHLRRRSEGDAATKQKQQQQQFEQKCQHGAANAKTYASDSITSITNTSTTANGHAGGTTTFLPPRRVSLGDSSESNNRTASASNELQIKCRNNKCDRTATPADAKKYYKSCHNCTYLYCSRECRRAHWEKHRKACLHSRVSNLCRQVLAACKDDSDSLRHLSLLARKGFLSQGRGVVRILFRSPEAAEGFIKNGFQCMGEASYVRWPDLMPAEMGLELYSELLKLSTEYRPDSKMLVYVAVCVVSEAPGMGQAPVRWERQLVSRCAKLKLCKTVLAELEQQQQPLPQPVTVVAVPEPTTEVLILTFNPTLRNSTAQRELVLSNILDILSRRGVILRKHYPEIFQRLQTYTEGQTDKFNPVTLHPRDSHTGQNFVCIIMPVQSETEIIKLPSIADGGNRVTSIDVGSSAALAQLDDDELLTRTASVAS